VALIFVLGFTQISIITKLTESFINSRLEHDSESLLATINFDTAGEATQTFKHPSIVYNQPYSGHYFYITIAGRSDPIRSRSLWDNSLEIPTPEIGQPNIIHQDGPNGQSLLVYIASYQKQGQTITIATAEDITPLRQQLTFYSLLLVGFALLALVLLLLLQRFIIKSSFRPVKQVHQEILQLAEGKQGFLSENVPDEIQPLVKAVNHLLSVMTSRLDRSRNALGNLAHTLKTPLNLLSQMASLPEIQKQAELSDELQEHTDRMQQIINHELKRARLAGSGTLGQCFSPAKEIPNIIKILKQIYHDKSLIFECDITEEVFGDTDRDDMLELIGNLLDNSCKWAHHKIKCIIKTTPQLTIIIEDDGPGCSSNDLEIITQRGVRADETISGHGLGLTIVKEIAQIYHFDLYLDNSPELGGLRIQLIQQIQSKEITP
jgi:signal transduction histidine kinase